jgi:hypothetical protein
MESFRQIREATYEELIEDIEEIISNSIKKNIPGER